MKGEHSKWGPAFGHYLKLIDGRREEALENYLASRETINTAHDGLIPLPLLETMLAVGENMHKIKYQHGGQSLPVLMSTMRQYMQLNTRGVFDYYYGYLCMKHIIRTICIAALIETKTLDDFLDGLDSEELDILVAESLSERSLDVMKQSSLEKDITKLPVYLGLNPPSWDAFPCVGGLSFDDAYFLLSTLWDNRHRLITLIESSMLPGFAALLFVFCHMNLYSDAPSETQKRAWTQLQDITVRFYLAGFQWLETYQLILCVNSHMLRPIQDQKTGPRSRLGVDVSAILIQYVDTLVTKKLGDVLPAVERTGLERLWLELDRERNGSVAASWGLNTQWFAVNTFRSLITMQDRLEAPANRVALANTFFEVDVTGLAGRVMLLALQATSSEFWGYLLEVLDSLADSITGPMLISEPLSEANAVNWVKVNDQLKMRHLKMTPCGVPMSYLLQAMKCWESFSPPIRSNMCSNPRCAVGIIYANPPDAHHTCGRCIDALYCSQWCQRVHWCLSAGQSHRAGCISDVML
ncbi:hypothetical protein FRC08_003563 [Ceratobasidium sp. 394]|nr:hypothetical protein FRC08_003563 [Ceratobasidium sp. 394]